jgi:hypothetical protein
MQHLSLEQRINDIAEFKLIAEVPEDICIHFETGKNLYVFAWHVYRFHVVAEQHVLSTLEMALRLRLFGTIASKKGAGLAKLLNEARMKRLIENERLRGRHRWIFEQARHRHLLATIQKMSDEGISEYPIDYSEAQPNDEDLNYDWLAHFATALPALRNMHAHGSQVLYPDVRPTFEIVSDLINQLFTSVAT